MVLKLVDTRVEKNSKVEMYTGHYLGHVVDAVKIYKRASAFHPFKFTHEIFKCDLQEEPFSSIGPLKKLVESFESLVK